MMAFVKSMHEEMLVLILLFSITNKAYMQIVRRPPRIHVGGAHQPNDGMIPGFGGGQPPGFQTGHFNQGQSDIDSRRHRGLNQQGLMNLEQGGQDTSFSPDHRSFTIQRRIPGRNNQGLGSIVSNAVIRNPFSRSGNSQSGPETPFIASEGQFGSTNVGDAFGFQSERFDRPRSGQNTQTSHLGQQTEDIVSGMGSLANPGFESASFTSDRMRNNILQNSHRQRDRQLNPDFGMSHERFETKQLQSTRNGAGVKENYFRSASSTNSKEVGISRPQKMESASMTQGHENGMLHEQQTASESKVVDKGTGISASNIFSSRSQKSVHESGGLKHFEHSTEFSFGRSLSAPPQTGLPSPAADSSIPSLEKVVTRKVEELSTNKRQSPMRERLQGTRSRKPADLSKNHPHNIPPPNMVSPGSQPIPPAIDPIKRLVDSVKKHTRDLINIAPPAAGTVLQPDLPRIDPIVPDVLSPGNQVDMQFSEEIIKPTPLSKITPAAVQPLSPLAKSKAGADKLSPSNLLNITFNGALNKVREIAQKLVKSSAITVKRVPHDGPKLIPKHRLSSLPEPDVLGPSLQSAVESRLPQISLSPTPFQVHMTPDIDPMPLDPKTAGAHPSDSIPGIDGPSLSDTAMTPEEHLSGTVSQLGIRSQTNIGVLETIPKAQPFPGTQALRKKQITVGVNGVNAPKVIKSGRAGSHTDSSKVNSLAGWGSMLEKELLAGQGADETVAKKTSHFLSAKDPFEINQSTSSSQFLNKQGVEQSQSEQIFNDPKTEATLRDIGLGDLLDNNKLKESTAAETNPSTKLSEDTVAILNDIGLGPLLMETGAIEVKQLNIGKEKLNSSQTEADSVKSSKGISEITLSENTPEKMLHSRKGPQSKDPSFVALELPKSNGKNVKESVVKTEMPVQLRPGLKQEPQDKQVIEKITVTTEKLIKANMYGKDDELVLVPGNNLDKQTTIAASADKNVPIINQTITSASTFHHLAVKVPTDGNDPSEKSLPTFTKGNPKLFSTNKESNFFKNTDTTIQATDSESNAVIPNTKTDTSSKQNKYNSDFSGCSNCASAVRKEMTDPYIRDTETAIPHAPKGITTKGSGVSVKEEKAMRIYPSSTAGQQNIETPVAQNRIHFKMQMPTPKQLAFNKEVLNSFLNHSQAAQSLKTSADHDIGTVKQSTTFTGNLMNTAIRLIIITPKQKIGNKDIADSSSDHSKETGLVLPKLSPFKKTVVHVRPIHDVTRQSRNETPGTKTRIVPKERTVSVETEAHSNTNFSPRTFDLTEQIHGPFFSDHQQQSPTLLNTETRPETQTRTRTSEETSDIRRSHFISGRPTERTQPSRLMSRYGYFGPRRFPTADFLSDRIQDELRSTSSFYRDPFQFVDRSPYQHFWGLRDPSVFRARYPVTGQTFFRDDQRRPRISPFRSIYSPAGYAGMPARRRTGDTMSPVGMAMAVPPAYGRRLGMDRFMFTGSRFPSFGGLARRRRAF